MTPHSRASTRATDDEAQVSNLPTPNERFDLRAFGLHGNAQRITKKGQPMTMTETEDYEQDGEGM